MDCSVGGLLWVPQGHRGADAWCVGHGACECAAVLMLLPVAQGPLGSCFSKRPIFNPSGNFDLKAIPAG